MKTSHSILCFLTSVAYGLVYAIGEIPTGRDVIDKAEDPVGSSVARAADLVSVSFAPQSPICLRVQVATPRNIHF